MQHNDKSRPSSFVPGAPAQPVDAVVLGEAVIDLYADPGVELQDAARFTRHLGGAGANLAVCLQRQGVQTAFVGMVGNDGFGRHLRQRLYEEGVATDGLLHHRSARTGVVFVSQGAGRPAFLPYRQPSADVLLGAAELNPAHITRGRLLCVGAATLLQEPARGATQRALELARAARRLIACDLNYRPHQWSDAKEAVAQLRKLLSTADVVKLSAEEVLPLTGVSEIETAAAKVRSLGPALVVITQGGSGCFVDGPGGQAFLAGEAVRVVDKTGAGDAFTAGLLTGVLQALGRSEEPRAALSALTLVQVKRACVLGNHLGALACTAQGATTAVPRAS